MLLKYFLPIILMIQPDNHQLASKMTIHVLPFDFNNSLDIEFFYATKDVDLRLYNQTGSLILKKQIQHLPTNTTMSLGNDFENGIYQLVVVGNDGQTRTVIFHILKEA